MEVPLLSALFYGSLVVGLASILTAWACQRRHQRQIERVERSSRLAMARAHRTMVAKLGGTEEYALALIRKELSSAQGHYGPMRSPHEGHSIIREEFMELEGEVFAKHGQRDEDKLRSEATQVGAMAARFIVDIVEGGKSQL